MVLSLDTTQFEKTRLVLTREDGKIMDNLEFKAGKTLSERLLSKIDLLLGRNGINLEDLRAIRVNSGPGSFTGIRIGIAVANALGFALKIPVNGSKMAIPKYGEDPKITI